MWVIFHKNCLDGTGSAAAVLKKFNKVNLFPINHSYTEENIKELLEIKGDIFYVVDFSLKKGDFIKILNNNNTVIHIDHHITAIEDVEFLKKYKNYISVFDIHHSGAFLTWHYLFNEVPELIYFIEDRDIWKKEYKETDVICYYLFGKVLDKPEELLKYLEMDIQDIYSRGLELQKYLESNIQQTLEKVEPLWLTIKTGKFFKKIRIPALNSTYYSSELGNIVAKNYDGISCIFYISGKDVKLSFRSIEGAKITAKDVAILFKGGGHIHAAGARISLKKFVKLIK